MPQLVYCIDSTKYNGLKLNLFETRYCNIDELSMMVKNFKFLIVTSKRAAKALAAVPNLPGDLVIYSVGEATTACLPSTVEAIGNTGSAESLANFVVNHHRERLEPLLFLTGDKSLKTIPTALEQANKNFTELRVYETVPKGSIKKDLINILESNNQVILVFFSPSGVDAVMNVFSEEFRKLYNPLFASIGPTTSQRLRELGLPIIAEAKTPTLDGISDALDKFI